jgi:3alpha(or 20beta)-hydroxysteroid dehydrogenase
VKKKIGTFGKSVSARSGRLSGKIALITGAAGGQGLETARLFHAEGAEVIGSDIAAERGEAAAAEIGTAFVQHDVADEASWQAVIDAVLNRFGRIDLLVNNAGIFLRAGLLETSLDDYRRVIEVNQTGCFLGMRAAAVPMREQGSGSIINISSIAGLRAAPGGFAYGASKWAVTGMTRSAARSLGPHGVRVNSVHPGMIETDMMNAVTNDSEEMHNALAASVPLGGRHAGPAEVAPLLLFLASDESRYCTGGAYVVDGGVLA